MNKIISFFLVFDCLLSLKVMAQTNVFPPDGNTGIGTTVPGEKLEVNGNIKLSGDVVSRIDGSAFRVTTGSWGSSWIIGKGYDLSQGDYTRIGVAGGPDYSASGIWLYGSSGNVGIGMNTPSARLHVNGSIKSAGDFTGTGSFRVDAPGGGWPSTLLIGKGYDLSKGDFTKIGVTGGIDYSASGIWMYGTTGFVGIGTDSPREKLSVNGSIRAREIKVESVNWPDYVFEPDHARLSLTELAEYINTNRHLPEIPSAGEVERDGLSLGDMNSRLLKKIEELTLYLIEKDKELSGLKVALKQKDEETESWKASVEIRLRELASKAQ
ncbi:hypothetical protein GS399_05280 [Pedobacter sp. HMF7647]|uniref:Peptidase S74 domain-containing protein n=1 Tax=Hufsiella arboris TaxID=2695275 RepID=A0A7K1Y733_9SPHI|nr:hypothetical protein [Hufsiella arboris]MXV50377.1 hypothetical protein [Hufsiella arboris]